MMETDTDLDNIGTFNIKLIGNIFEFSFFKDIL